MTTALLSGIAETTPAVVLLALSLFGAAILSFAPDTRAAREFVEDYGVLLLVGAVAGGAVVGVTLFLVGDKSLAKEWLNQYGLLALFFILILEGAMLLYFAPSESLVPIGVSVLPASATDYDAIAAVILVAVVGATIGQYTLFLLAKRGGREYLLDKPWFRVSEDSLDRFEGWFQRWGRVVVPVSNALLFTRGMLTVPAGFAEMRDWEFVLLSALGTLLFQTWLAAAALYTLQNDLLSFLPF
ncbi:DedA family protein [Halomicrococcus gelatinilyticus]|uniref:DedA family protein n=1 Tax=Halomicrococcus gelatinilyticus TaxID=1702103 RepID=UPI002E16408F